MARVSQPAFHHRIEDKLVIKGSGAESHPRHIPRGGRAAGSYIEGTFYLQHPPFTRQVVCEF
ncbi:hypothetical protein E2C01_069000 [Portunus trituberculatus]|uniref:Uncharacterized protein n=1 Tax=Portunus trituberculatus TaxID=210409 RepID=A0A5B7HTH7_PORTR|nr:hypothetical protein [Portunus trituberculatus]